MKNYDWAVVFREVYHAAAGKYQNGSTGLNTLFGENEKLFLQSIGCSTQELYDFVEDFCRMNEPKFETVLLVTDVRRDYFRREQKERLSSKRIATSDLPPKGASLGGVEWLPRIIEKARAKLRGEMPADLMYLCGGDRPFLKSVNVHPADFLREVWRAGENTAQIVAYVEEQRRRDARE